MEIKLQEQSKNSLKIVSEAQSEISRLNTLKSTKSCSLSDRFIGLQKTKNEKIYKEVSEVKNVLANIKRKLELITYKRDS
jgi:hypothetical protein